MELYEGGPPLAELLADYDRLPATNFYDDRGIEWRVGEWGMLLYSRYAPTLNRLLHLRYEDMVVAASLLFTTKRGWLPGRHRPYEHRVFLRDCTLAAGYSYGTDPVIYAGLRALHPHHSTHLGRSALLRGLAGMNHARTAAGLPLLYDADVLFPDRYRRACFTKPIADVRALLAKKGVASVRRRA